MARITVEDCLKRVDNRFALIHLAAKRVRQLRKGAEPLVQAKNSDVVVALREIAAGKVYPVEGEPEALSEAQIQQLLAPEEEPAEALVEGEEKEPDKAEENKEAEPVT